MATPKSTEEWQDAIDNPDPRVKWAMQVMSQEGEEFTSMLERAWVPVATGTFPIIATMVKNVSSRLPLRTNLFAAICTMPLFVWGGEQWKKINDLKATEETAMMKHYILTHPERFPEPKRVKYLNEIVEWRPVRW